MREYFNTRTRISSLFTGLIVVLFAQFGFSMLGLEKPMVWALIAGLTVTLVLSVLTPLNLYMRDKRYIGIEETLPKPVLLKAGVSIRGKDRPREGYLYLTEDTMYLYARDRKPYAFQELPKTQIRELKVEREVFMTFKFANTALYSLASAQCNEILDFMHSHGWNVF